MADDITAHEPEIEELSHRRVLSWIYGLVVCAAVLAASSDLRGGWGVAGYVFVSLFVYWAAEGYAHILASRTVLHRASTWSEVRYTLREGWVLVSASYLPLVAVVVCTLLDKPIDVIVDAGLVVCTVLLFVAGFNAGRESGLAGWRLLVSAFVASLFGLAMVVLKYAIH